jgi:hypothetical protein
MAGYTRTDTANNIANGNVINANDLDAEYNAVEASFNASSGHKHDGTAAEGAPITKVGPSQDLIVSSSSVLPKTPNTLDLGSVGVQFKDGYFDGVLYADSSVHGVNGLSSIGDNVYTVSSGGLSVDVDGDITLNPTGLDVVLASGGTPYGSLTNTSSNLTIKSGTTTAVTLTGANTALAGTLGVASNITVGGTVDGRDVATDGSKLDTIETSATADQTNAEIRAAVEAASDSNVFTDADHTKLNSVESSADVTDATNVAAAGALMDSEVTNLAQVKAFSSSDYATATRTISAGAGLTGGGNLTTNRTISHADTSSQASVDNSGTTFIQDITLDTYGHITSIGSASLPTASSSTLGGIKIGSGLSISSGVVSVSTGFADANYFNYGGTGGSAASAGTQSISIGEDAEALSEASIAIGLNATTVLYNTSYRPGSIAIGMNTLTTGESSISIGSNAAGNGGSATSIGYNSDATGNGATAVGAYSQALGIRSVAIGGNGQDPTSSNGLSGPTASNNSCIAIGDATAIGEYSIAIGGTARGASNTSSGLSSIAIGKFAIISTNAFGGVAIGQQTSCGYNSESQIGNVAVGSGAKARNAGSVSVGYNSDCVSGSGGAGVNNVALGKQAQVSGSSNTGNSVALGYAAAVTTSNTIRLGNSSISSLLCQDTTISTSDVRDKTDFEALNYGLDFVKAIPTYKYKRNNRGEYYTLSPELDEDENRVYTYDEDGYNNETKKLDRVDFGFKAQEVEALIQSNERLVSTTTEPEGFELKSFAHSDMTPILWKAVQELSAKNDALEARIVALEA